MDFTHLHVHTQFSLLDGSCKINELVNKAVEEGYDALAITDHGVMYGCIDFYKACKKAGIKPVIGCEVYVAPGSRFDKTGGISDDRYYHLILLAENQTGYQNLIKIVSKGFTEGFYYKPRIDHELLEEYHEGLICLSACLAGEIPSYITKGFYEEAKEIALYYQNLFGKDNFFLELQDHGIPAQKTVNQAILRMHAETGIPMVATNDVHYTNKDDYEAHDILLCIQTQKKVMDEDRMRYAPEQFYLRSKEEMEELFPYAKEALLNTKKISDRCNVDLDGHGYHLPKFDVPGGLTAEEYLVKLCNEGLKKRYPENYAEHEERLHYEIDTIKSMGFVDYFLIVSDFIKYAKDNDIPVGPGRGSAAGSIVAYCLEITDIDPIKYQLIFERFLNPERVTMPDIDIDFCYERRPEVIDYVVQKYGIDQVVQIVTFGTMAARNVIRDVGRAMDIPYSKCDLIAKMIPQELNITIEKALVMNPELKELYDSDEETTKLISICKKLEGLPRHTSIHAAGVVICDRAVDEYVPLQRSADDIITTQYTMTTIEEQGLLKMDFLGLRTLTVLHDAETLIKEKNKDFRLKDISYEDASVYELLASGKTEGVFQLESAGMKSFMKELKPGNIEDVIAGISLYRPGPMDFIPKYIKGKNNPESIVYDTPLLEPILKPTYGCIVYQEQVMQIVRDLAGYSFGRSDMVRRAMSKKKADVMERERKNFVYGNEAEGVPGCASKGISPDIANKIFDEMTDFAKYAFNKSHAACYAVVAYQTAFLKKHYPVEFMAALMTSVVNNTAKITAYIQSVKGMGIKVLPPDINICKAAFSASGDAIRYGMSAVKGLGKPVIDAIVAEREANGDFKDIQDFCERLSGKEVNKRTVESFIKSGAFDSLPGTRKQLMAVYTRVMDSVSLERKKAITGQLSFFDLMSDDDPNKLERVTYPDVGEFDKEDLLSYEKEVLGIYVSGHPLEQYDKMISDNISHYSSAFVLDEETNIPEVEQDSSEILAGIISTKTVKTTRSNTMMCFFTLEDVYGDVEIVVFPRDFEKLRGKIVEGQKVFVKGRVSIEDDKPAKLICQDILNFSEIPNEVWIKYPDVDSAKADDEGLKTLIAQFPGKDKIILYCEKEKAIKMLPESIKVNMDENTLPYFTERYGEKNISVKAISVKKKIWKSYT